MTASVAIIGTGRLGTALALGLKGAGYEVKFLASKPPSGAKQIAGKVGALVIEPPYRELVEADLVFLTVPDSVIEGVADEIARSTVEWKGRTVIHCSGALTTDVLAPITERGGNTLSIHPLQTFPPGSEPERFKGIYFAVEGEDYPLGERIARDLGGIPFRLKADSKVLYHASATIASNYLFVLASAAAETLKAAGIEAEDLSKMLFPLMQGTLDSIRELGIREGLTGPISRADVETVEKHLNMLSDYPELQNLYKTMGRWLLSSIEMAPNAKKRLESVLKG